MKKPVISVIIPVFNEKNEYLKKCLDSVCSQTFSDYEIIISDDGMNSENRLLTDQYRNKYGFVQIVGGRNEGVSAARNRGLKCAKGEWIAFVDSDDWLEPSYLEKLYFAALSKDADAVLCGYKRTYDLSEELIVREKSFEMNQEEFLHMLLNVQNGFGFVHMKLYRASLFIRGCRFDESLSLAEDALLNICIAEKAEHFYYLAEPLYNYRFNQNSAVRKFKKDYVESFRRSMELTAKHIQNEKFRTDYHNYVAYHVMLILVNYCCHPDNPEKGVKSIKNVISIPVFDQGIQGSDYNGLSLTRKITLFTLKYKLYYLAEQIGNYRQKQFKRSSR